MDILQPIAAIVLVIGLLAAALLLLRKRGAVAFRLPSSVGSSRERRLEVLERVALGPQHSVHLVRVGERCVLIGTAPSSCQLLETLPGEVRAQRGEF
jgi:flagellar biosynthetic protein FliO